MKRTGSLFAVILLLVCINLLAQQKGKNAAAGAAPKARRMTVPDVYLGNSEVREGTIPKKQFSDLMKQGLTSRDSMGRTYKVVSFNFTFGERNLYEDSIGNLQIKTDFASMYCHGDTLPDVLTRYIPASQSKINEETPGFYQRVKAGDTIYFDRISVVRYTPNAPLPPESDAILGRKMKLVITK
ncbi:MAG: hypothetical protein V4649_19065 [Bacteroidota bacterium]